MGIEKLAAGIEVRTGDDLQIEGEQAYFIDGVTALELISRNSQLIVHGDDSLTILNLARYLSKNTAFDTSIGIIQIKDVGEKRSALVYLLNEFQRKGLLASNQSYGEVDGDVSYVIPEHVPLMKRFSRKREAHYEAKTANLDDLRMILTDKGYSDAHATAIYLALKGNPEEMTKPTVEAHTTFPIANAG